jgi:hypothetical protein
MINITYNNINQVVPKRQEVTEGWGKLHHEEHRNLYSPPVIIMGDQIKEEGRHVACMGEIRNA